METPTEKCRFCGYKDYTCPEHSGDTHPTPPPAALTPEWKSLWLEKCDGCITATHCAHHRRCLACCVPSDIASPPPARAEAPDGELVKPKACNPTGLCWVYGAADMDEYLAAKDAEIARLTQALEQAQCSKRAREEYWLDKWGGEFKRAEKFKAERDQQAGALVTLRAEHEEARQLLDRVQRCDALADCADCMTAVESYLAALAALAAVPASNNHNKGAKHMEAAVIRPTLYTRHPDGFRSVDGSTFVPVPAPTTLETNLLGDHLCHACDGACDCCQPDECVTCSRCGKAVLAFKEATNDNK
jgi:hypothetical protein